jgi:cell division protein FtsW
MGESTLTNPANTRPLKQAPHPLRMQFDVPMLLAVITLIIFGLLMVYSASWEFSVSTDHVPSYVLGKQITFALGGAMIAFVASRVDYHRYQKWAFWILLFTLGSLVAVLIVNRNSDDPARTLVARSVQPSEMAKLVMILYLSVWLNSKKDRLNEAGFGLIPMIFIIGITCGFIMLQTDISAAATIYILGGLLFFLAKADVRQVFLVIIFAVVLGVVVVNITNTGRDRMQKFTYGFSDPEKADYQIRGSFNAIVNGGIFGVGIGKGVIKNLVLPVAWTDSIFSVIVEETGLAGASLVIALYLIILWRGLRIARRAPDLLGQLIAGGITFWIVIEAIMNMAVMVNLIPVTGNALPFISAGGSSLMTTLLGVGILMGVGRSGIEEATTEEGRNFNAAVDLRWRDRRRRVSRTGRAGSARP